MKKQLATIGLVTGVGQLVALVKMWLVARYFGVGADLDGYNLALVLPTWVSGVISGALQTGLFPVYAQLRVRSPETLARLERTLFLSLLGVGTAISLALFVGAPQLGLFVGQEASLQTQQAAAYVLRFVAFTVVLNAIGDYLGFLLALHQRFVFAAAAPIASGLVGVVLLASWPEGGLTNIALGTALGVVAQLVIVLRGIMTTNVSLLRAPRRGIDLGVHLREILRLSTWILPGVVFANLTTALPPLLVAPFGDGAVSAFGYAFRFHQSTIQILIMAVSPVILARFSDLVAARDWRTLQSLQRKAFRVSIGLGALAVVGIAVFGEAVLQRVLAHGRFDEMAAHRVAVHWMVLSCALGISLYGNALAKRIQASKGAKALSLLALSGTLALVSFTWLFEKWFGEMAVPAALVLAAVVPTFLMSMLLRTAGFQRSEGRGGAVEQTS